MEYHDPTFSLEEQIRKQVAHEDMVAWAKRPPSPLPANKPLPKLKLTPVAAYMLGKQMIKKTINIMTP